MQHCRVACLDLKDVIYLTFIMLLVSHRVTKLTYLVPIPIQDKLGGLCEKGHPV